EADAHVRRALQRDPLSFLMNRRLGATLYLARDYDAALVPLQRAAEMEVHLGSVDSYMSLIYEQRGQRALAVQYDLSARDEARQQIDAALFLRFITSTDGKPIGGRAARYSSLSQ